VAHLQPRRAHCIACKHCFFSRHHIVTSDLCRGVFMCFTCVHEPSSTATFFTMGFDGLYKLVRECCYLIYMPNPHWGWQGGRRMT
jgi:hypothetical protein